MVDQNTAIIIAQYVYGLFDKFMKIDAIIAVDRQFISYKKMKRAGLTSVAGSTDRFLRRWLGSPYDSGLWDHGAGRSVLSESPIGLAIPLLKERQYEHDGATVTRKRPTAS
jgi:hypothetical protein